MNNFCAFILTHGRPDKVYTYNTLRKHGYTGKIILVLDNEDKTAALYEKKYPGQTVIFDKKSMAERIDEGDNFDDRRAIIYARNACFDIAESIGVDYFVQLDDDYIDFRYKKNETLDNINKYDIKSLDKIFSLMSDFLISSGFTSISMAQGGDFLGGKNGNAVKNPQLRKCMNSFFCSTKNRFYFFGRINEDVNTYTEGQRKGNKFLTIPFIALQQKQTQANSGGMTETYLTSGTYVKSFYSVMYCPSAVKVKLMQSRHPRLHHSISWKNAVPVILSEDNKKWS